MTRTTQHNDRDNRGKTYDSATQIWTVFREMIHLNYDLPQGSEFSWNGRYNKNWQEFQISSISLKCGRIRRFYSCIWLF